MTINNGEQVIDLAKALGAMAKEADMVCVVRCKDCKYQSKGENESESWNLCGYRPWQYIPTSDDHYCSYGERKDGDADDE